MTNINKIVEKLQAEYPNAMIDEQMSEYQSQWLQWYQGKVKGFHEYTAYAGTDQSQTRKRYSLGMAKVISELWADYMYNPETKVQIEDKAVQKWWDDKDHDILFSSNMNNFMELVFALGTGATVQYKDSNGIANVDYIRYDMIIPLETINTDIVSCAFVSEYAEDTIYINIHELQDDGSFLITNKFYEVDDQGEVTNEIAVEDVDDDLQESFVSPVQLFQIYKPAIANNKVIGSPLGISIFGNADDELRSSDIAYDALTKEVEHGKIRIYVKEGALDISMEDGGKKVQTFSKGEEFYILKGDDTFENEQLIDTATPSLREVLMDFVETHLNILGRKCGLGNDAFSNKDGTIYTNTASVISTNSRFFATREKHGTLMKENIINLVKGLYWLENESELEKPIAVQMDDSILHDEQQELHDNIVMYNTGIYSEIYLIMQHQKLDREQAEQFYQQMQKDKGLREEIEFEE